MTVKGGETSKQHREALVEALITSGTIRSRAVRDAFAAIPREAFVSSFYQEQGRNWKPLSSTDLPEQEWLAALYTDASLVTKLSGRHVPLSSSSMPSVMARMLEALQVEPGMRVLEIGTGTGYNAALLATLTGNPSCVTTIEVDGRLAAQAQHALRDTVGAVQVQVGDGLQEADEGRSIPFDRIIATASCRAFPWVWYHQLAPGGRLVMDLQGKLGVSSFCVLVKSPHGSSASGSFLTPPLYFMPMQEEVFPAYPPAGFAHTAWSLPAEHPLSRQLQEDAFRWFLQWRLPGVSGSRGAMLYAPRKERVEWLRFRDRTGPTQLDMEQRDGGAWRLQCGGPITLWEHMESAFAEWEALGQPPQHAYHLEIYHDEGAFLIAQSCLPWSCPDEWKCV